MQPPLNYPEAISALTRWGLGSARYYNDGLNECQRHANELRAGLPAGADALTAYLDRVALPAVRDVAKNHTASQAEELIACLGSLNVDGTGQLNSTQNGEAAMAELRNGLASYASKPKPHNFNKAGPVRAPRRPDGSTSDL